MDYLLALHMCDLWGGTFNYPPYREYIIPYCFFDDLLLRW